MCGSPPNGCPHFLDATMRGGGTESRLLYGDKVAATEPLHHKDEWITVSLSI